MAKRVYIETTIPSFYFEARSDAEMVARRAWTRRWWQDAADRYELVTSVAVVEELTRGDFPSRDDRAVRAVRTKISAEYANDPDALVAHCVVEQERYRERLLRPVVAQRSEATDAASHRR